MEREVGGGIGMGNTCKPMADSFQCMTKSTTIKKKKKKKKQWRRKKKRKCHVSSIAVTLSVRDYLIFPIRINCRCSSSVEIVVPLCSKTKGGHRSHLPRKTGCLRSRKKILTEENKQTKNPSSRYQDIRK